MYGERINLNIEGKSTYKTNCGAVLSLITILTVLVYGVFKMTVLLGREDTNFTSAEEIGYFHETD